MDNKDLPQPSSSLTLQQEALVFGMLHDTKTTTDYSATPEGRMHNFRLEPNGFDQLVAVFKTDPKRYLAQARQNLFAISSDPKLPPEKRQARLQRYVDAYLSLIPALDKKAFPPAPDHIQRNIPDYIPDGLTDMGSDPTLEPQARNREKIRVNKPELFKQAKQMLCEVFALNLGSDDSDQAKMYLAQRVAHFVYTNMPYDYKNEVFRNPSRSVSLDRYFDAKLAQCRHHALYTQVLLQVFGLTSRLMKSDLSINGDNPTPHANNLVRINNSWYLLDTTNPESNNGRSQIFIKPLLEKDVNLNTGTYTWKLQSGNDTRTYISRNNMYWKIEDNTRSLIA